MFSSCFAISTIKLQFLVAIVHVFRIYVSIHDIIVIPKLITSGLVQSHVLHSATFFFELLITDLFIVGGRDSFVE